MPSSPIFRKLPRHISRYAVWKESTAMSLSERNTSAFATAWRDTANLRRDSFRPARVLAIPSLGAGVERHVHGRGIRLAPHLRNAALGACFPRNLRRARGDGAADVVRNILG